MTRLLVVDGNSLAHRAYHALAAEATASGFVVGGIVRMIASAWYEGPFDGVLVAFDDPGPSRRRELEPRYKAHRPPTPPALTEELAAAPVELARAGLCVATTAGAEADDLLAAAADACTARGWECALLSSDRDIVALVSETVTLLRPRRHMRDLTVYDPAGVVREFGVPPHLYTDLAALRGDPSDGLDGVPGIGTKTAARLVAAYGGVPGIYAALHHLDPRTEAALRGARAIVERNLLLMAPLPRLAVDIEAAAATLDVDRLAAVLGPLGLGDAAGKLTRALAFVGRPPMPPLPSEAAGHLSGDGNERAPRPAPVPALVVEQAALF